MGGVVQVIARSLRAGSADFATRNGGWAIVQVFAPLALEASNDPSQLLCQRGATQYR